MTYVVPFTDAIIFLSTCPIISTFSPLSHGLLNSQTASRMLCRTLPPSHAPPSLVQLIFFILDANPANAHTRDTKGRESPKPPQSSVQAESSHSSAHSQYLPGGSLYRKSLSDNSAGNPRGDTPVPQWLQEWETKWENITGEGKPSSMLLHKHEQRCCCLPSSAKPKL